MARRKKGRVMEVINGGKEEGRGKGRVKGKGKLEVKDRKREEGKKKRINLPFPSGSPGTLPSNSTP